MITFLVSLLVLLLYALIIVLVLELIFYIVGMFFPVPPRIRQIIYAIVGLILLIWLIQAVAAGTPIRFPAWR